jgi:hypothetical protein
MSNIIQVSNRPSLAPKGVGSFLTICQEQDHCTSAQYCALVQLAQPGPGWPGQFYLTGLEELWYTLQMQIIILVKRLPQANFQANHRL